MRKVKIMYWVCTGLVALLMGAGSIPHLLSSAGSVSIFQQLGYPAYLLPFLGVAKLLGVIVILVPGFPKIKEWAYAGLAFDLLGATYSFIAVGTPEPIMLLWLLVLAGSYVTYQKLKKADFLAAQNVRGLQIRKDAV